MHPPVHKWWDDHPDEKFWLEITDRPDLGVDLKAPQTDDNGHEYWSYSLVTEVKDGDIVFHYHKPKAAIVAWSRAVGTYWHDAIVWAAHGTVAREAGVTPYRRPGWALGLEDFSLLDHPVSLQEIREREPELKTMVTKLEVTH